MVSGHPPAVRRDSNSPTRTANGYLQSHGWRERDSQREVVARGQGLESVASTNLEVRPASLVEYGSDSDDRAR